MGTPNTELQNWLLQQNPKMTKAASDQVIKELEDSFIKAAQAGGASAADLLKIAQEQPATWHNLVNNYVTECVVAAQQQKVAEAQAQQAEQEKLAAAAEAVHLGQTMAHAFLDELHKIAEASEGEGMPPALREALDKEDKGNKDKDKSEPDKDNGVNREPDKDDKDKKEASRLPLNARVMKATIEKKASANIAPTAEEVDFLALCKLAEAGYNVDFTGVK